MRFGRRSVSERGSRGRGRDRQALCGPDGGRVDRLIGPTTWPRGAGAGHGLRQGMAAKGGKSPVRGFWYKTKPHGLDDGREGLQTGLSALRYSATAITR